MTADIPCLRNAPNFFNKGILICYSCSQILGLFHPSEVFITYLFVEILSCILVSTHNHIHTFLSIYF